MCAWQPEAQTLTVPNVLRLRLLLIYPTQYARSNSVTSALGLLSRSEGSLLQFPLLCLRGIMHLGILLSFTSMHRTLRTILLQDEAHRLYSREGCMSKHSRWKKTQ